ncbi:hypothetical protein ASG87_03760 [Frateuria sp. Soil773]|uniref:thioredoxin family protein n=1 Tax=Frateuria sp. Soil773 TaxID=1736407 RepID=UPI0006F50116|nr:thioredoxin family protein [Frateuria sp. Soil773]KRE89460.1 hypothetical protein ASG87_03760 [Frateuria sp. Soil773]
MRPSTFLALLLAGIAFHGAARAEAVLTSVDDALRVAQAKQLPVFVDFSAAWCHSCHAMEAKVLNGPEWEVMRRRFVLVRSDADSVEGHAWMNKLHVAFLPTYVVLDPNGKERGQLTGEMESARFYRDLDGLLNNTRTFDTLKADAARGSVEAVVAVLRAYDDRNRPQDGLDWFATLPAATRKAVQGDDKAAARLAIVQTDAESGQLRRPKQSRAQRARLAEECRTHAQQALRGPLGMDDRFSMAGMLIDCADDLSPAKRKALAAAQLPALESLYETKMPTAESGDLRDATYTLAGYYKAVGDAAAEKATYERAIAIGRKALDDGRGGFDVKRDQAMADVLDEFLSMHGSQVDDIALRKAMAEAFPDNFIYQSQYGESLLKQGHATEALPYLQRASANASAADKLDITHSLAKALIALNRRPEAEKLFYAALHTAEKQFPKATKDAVTHWKHHGGVL